MENKVIMSLKDYNALKRKADIFESAVKLNIHSTWIDCNIDPRVIYPYVKCQLEELCATGALDKDAVEIKPINHWYTGITVATIEEKPDED